MLAEHRSTWSRHRRRTLAMLVVLAAFAPAAPAAARASSAHVGTIYACHRPDDPSDEEELHLIPSPGLCLPDEAELSWNIHGPPGPRGPRGPSGTDPQSHVNWTFSPRVVVRDRQQTSGGGSLEEWLGKAGQLLGVLVLGFAALVLVAAFLLAIAKWILHLLGRCCPCISRCPLLRWLLGPTLQVEPFDDKALSSRIGIAFTDAARARIGGGKDSGQRLYLVTGERPVGPELAHLEGLPQGKTLTAVLMLAKMLWRRDRLVATGSLMPSKSGHPAAATVSLRRNSRLVDAAEIVVDEQQSCPMNAAAASRALAVAVAAWIEHVAVDQTPGPPAREAYLSHDAHSWALFRAGAELSRASLTEAAEGLYERALALDGENIGALIDIAHLRRTEGHFEPAESLTLRAIELLEHRNCCCSGRRDDEDDNLYQAQIVLASSHGVWARKLEAECRDADARRHREAAYDLARKVTREAMAASNDLEVILGAKKLRLSAEGAALGCWTRWKARRRACRIGRRFDRHRIGTLHSLLETTYAPGALLLVATNLPRGAGLPLSPEAHGSGRGRRAYARERVEEQLHVQGRPDPEVLVEYVRMLQLCSPRVVYNLACCYGLAAKRGGAHRNDYLNIACEYLRQSIARTPPLERCRLLLHADEDPDLRELRKRCPKYIPDLWEIVPQQQREFGERSQTAGRQARRCPPRRLERLRKVCRCARRRVGLRRCLLRA